jgi:uncharacterized protein YkwD
MRRIALPAAALVLAACSVPVPPPSGASGGSTFPSAPPAVSADMPREVADLVNQHRSQVRCPALAWDDAAARAAQGHSDDMAARNYFSHTSPDGRQPWDRLRAQGAAFHLVAENIAMGQRTAQEVVQGWLASSGHRRNIENCAYTRTGVGYRDGRWTQLFYAP